MKMGDQEAVIEGSNTHFIRSELIGTDYLVSVGLPYDYDEEPEKKWPIVYLLDSNIFFGMTTEMVRIMALCGPTSDAVVVGIGYPLEIRIEEDWNEYLDSRFLDFSPVRDEQTEKLEQKRTGREVKSGGAGNFLEFLDSEVIRLVESNYRVDGNDRTLVGHSMGGLFTLYVVFHRPSLFNNYIAASPGMSSAKPILPELEESFAKDNNALPVRLILSMGELEKEYWGDHFDSMLHLYDQLVTRGYDQLEVVMKIYPDEDHCTVCPLSFQAGLKMVLRTE
jgi:predicted alpha/beta superfamily hydrolase